MASQGMLATERTTRWVEPSLSPDMGPVEGCGSLQGLQPIRTAPRPFAAFSICSQLSLTFIPP